MRKVLIIILFTSIAHIFQGQIPGYLGKRFTFGIEAKMQPTLRDGLFHGAIDMDYSQRFRFFKVIPEISLGWTIGKNIEMAFSYTNFNHEVELAAIPTFRNDSYYFYSVNDVVPKINKASSIYNVSTSIYNLKFRFFESGHFAPIGVFCQLGFGFARTKIRDEEKLLLKEYNYESSNGVATGSTMRIEQAYSIAHFSPGIYHRKGIGKMFYFQYGMESNIYFNFQSLIPIIDTPQSREYEVDIESTAEIKSKYLGLQAAESLSINTMFRLAFGAGIIF